MALPRIKYRCAHPHRIAQRAADGSFGANTIEATVAHLDIALDLSGGLARNKMNEATGRVFAEQGPLRSEEHTSELQSLMRISYAVFCLKKKNNMTKSTKDILINKKS